MNAIIRPATSADVPAILGLIRELAEYEKLAHEAKATADGLSAALFEPRPVAEALIAEVSGEAVGFALFFSTYSTFVGKPGIYLEDVYVKPEHRGGGIGKAFFRELGQLAVERGCGRLEWSVLERAGAAVLPEPGGDADVRVDNPSADGRGARAAGKVAGTRIVPATSFPRSRESGCVRRRSTTRREPGSGPRRPVGLASAPCSSPPRT